MYEVFDNLLVWSVISSSSFFFWRYKFPFARLKRPTLTSLRTPDEFELIFEPIYLCSFCSPPRVSNRSSENTKSKRERTCTERCVYDIVTITKNNKEYRVSVEMLRFLLDFSLSLDSNDEKYQPKRATTFQRQGETRQATEATVVINVKPKERNVLILSSEP